MKMNLYVLLTIAFAQSCLAEQKASKIYGTWSSNRDATTKYLMENAKLNDYQKKVLPTLFGRMEVTYREDGTGTAIFKAGRIPKRDGGEIALEETTLEFTFEILGESEYQVVIKSTSGESIFDDYPFSLIRFHDKDTSSVALSDGITDMNGREFFTRIRKDEANKPAHTTPDTP